MDSPLHPSLSSSLPSGAHSLIISSLIRSFTGLFLWTPIFSSVFLLLPLFSISVFLISPKFPPTHLRFFSAPTLFLQVFLFPRAVLLTKIIMCWVLYDVYVCVFEVCPSGLWKTAIIPVSCQRLFWVPRASVRPHTFVTTCVHVMNCECSVCVCVSACVC